MHRYILLLLIFIVALAACSPMAAAPSPQALPETQSPAPATDQPQATVEPPVASVEPPVVTEEPSSPIETSAPPARQDTIAYVGQDGNLWMVDLQDLVAPVAITQDAIPWPSDGSQAETIINYCCSAWSFDGKYLAFQREQGTLGNDRGYTFTYDLMLYEFDTGSVRTLLENQQTSGFAWSPVDSLLAYALPVDMGYFTARGQVDASLAKGIWAVDVEGGVPFEVVRPEKGLHLVNPVWSPDGRFIGFEEVLYMEGRGDFGYYDLRDAYIGSGEPLGNYAWTPDGETLVYDTQTYVANGTERIFQRPRLGGEPQPVSPEYEPGYSHQPAVSPQGDRVAYLAEVDGVETGRFTLFVVPLSGEAGDPALLGRPQELGRFEQQAFDLAWSPDGAYVYLVAGPYPDQGVVVIHVDSGETLTVAPGMYPAWRPAAP